MSPLGWTWWSFDKIRPTSLVRVANTSTLQKYNNFNTLGASKIGLLG